MKADKADRKPDLKKPPVGTSKVVGQAEPDKEKANEADLDSSFREHDRPTAKRNEHGELVQHDED